MAFTASKKEWNELCLFFRLLVEGGVWKGTLNGGINPNCFYPIESIERQEHDGARRYKIEKDQIIFETKESVKTIERSRFAEAAEQILNWVKTTQEPEVECDDAMEALLDEINIYDLQPHTQDRSDISIVFADQPTQAIGMMVRTKYGKIPPLLDGGRAANIKLELTGRRMSNPEICKINAIESDHTVADRIHYIEYLGGSLKYAEPADKLFRNNLSMIDLQFARVLAAMIRQMHESNIQSIKELTQWVENNNPLKIKEETIQKNGYYRYKMKQFLSALFDGMRATQIYRGTNNTLGGLLMLLPDGKVIAYRKGNNNELTDFLFENTRFEKGDLHKDHYGEVIKENGVYYLKLNVKVGFNKR